MTTIYFDKQIFSYLFKSKEDKHRNLLQKIIENKKDFIFLYSDAHLHDLYQDSTTLKYEELKFMKEIVDSNHLVYLYPCIQAGKLVFRPIYQQNKALLFLFSLKLLDCSRNVSCGVITDKRSVVTRSGVSPKRMPIPITRSREDMIEKIIHSQLLSVKIY